MIHGHTLADTLSRTASPLRSGSRAMTMMMSIKTPLPGTGTARA